MTPHWNRSLDLLEVHCQGEIGKVIVDGAPEIPGATALDKMNHINNVDDSLRRFVTFEPRASVAMTVNLLLAPTRPGADAGFIVLQADRAHPMSGSNCICVVTALLESGRVAMREPETIVRLDTPAGLIVARAECREGRCLSVGVDNVPSFAEMLDREIDTPRWGRIRADVAFGGVYYALVTRIRFGSRSNRRTPARWQRQGSSSRRYSPNRSASVTHSSPAWMKSPM
jgi:proline racemase